MSILSIDTELLNMEKIFYNYRKQPNKRTRGACVDIGPYIVHDILSKYIIFIRKILLNDINLYECSKSIPLCLIKWKYLINFIPETCVLGVHRETHVPHRRRSRVVRLRDCNTSIQEDRACWDSAHSKILQVLVKWYWDCNRIMYEKFTLKHYYL